MTKSLLAELRWLFIKKSGSECWEELRLLFETYPESQERDIALDYAAEHIASWDDPFVCSFSKVDKRHPCWKLAKHIDFSCKDSSNFSSFFSGCEHIESIALRHASNLSETSRDAIAKLSCLPQLKKLSIDISFIFEDCTPLATLTALEELAFHPADIFSGFAGLEKCQQLKKLTLPSIDEIEDIEVLSRLKSLEAIEVSCLDSQLVDILETLPNLQTLSVRWVDMLGFGFLSRLSSLKQFTSWDSSNNEPSLCQLPPCGIETLHFENACFEQFDIANLPNLSELTIRNCKNLQSIHGLTHTKQLSTLEVVENPVLSEVHGWETCEILHSLNFKKNPRLRLKGRKRQWDSREAVQAYQHQVIT